MDKSFPDEVELWELERSQQNGSPFIPKSKPSSGRIKDKMREILAWTIFVGIFLVPLGVFVFYFIEGYRGTPDPSKNRKAVTTTPKSGDGQSMRRTRQAHEDAQAGSPPPKEASTSPDAKSRVPSELVIGNPDQYMKGWFDSKLDSVPPFDEWWLERPELGDSLDIGLEQYVTQFGLVRVSEAGEPERVANARAKMMVLDAFDIERYFNGDEETCKNYMLYRLSLGAGKFWFRKDRST